ncbi:hypothetical protein LOTGIDRAFT_158109 [Lottia gigantea]|uniref:EGF-like domain-containing protein n=1 Tax=Lottia gigantea TaxID=225164 RepID=V4ARS9_LOTGI|nr:hypothetical protein LOTGIDRAFT_158109 [Lottia gigantea]ESO99947.1 hypothetical protein LOTGIDRAFT_158109 [Lottia gigantea]
MDTRRRTTSFFILISLGMLVVNTEGLETDHWGTQFIFSFIYPMHHNSKNIIAITAREVTKVRVIFQETQAVVKLTVQPGQTNHTWLDQIVIIATENDTSVTVSFKGFVQCINIGAQNNLQFSMDAYDVMNVFCNSDTSGTLITSSKPIAVITGSRQLQLHNFYVRGVVMEMLPPTTEFGTEFVFVTPHGHTGGTSIRIISEFGWQTTIFNNIYSNTPRQPSDIIINPGTYLCFTTSQPVLVVVFMTARTSYQYPTDTGNAYMMVIPPVTKFSNQYVIPMDIFGQYGYNNYYNRVDVIGKSPVNGLVPALPYFDMCPGYEASSSTVSLSGTIEFTANSQFIVLVYGFIYRDAFGFPGGMKLTDFSGTEECSSSPCLNEGWCVETALSYKCHCSDTRYTGQHCETDTVNDCDPNPCIFGICNDLSGFYTCSCHIGYIGYNCSTATPGQTTIATTTQEQTPIKSTTQEQTTTATTTQEHTTLDTTTQGQTTIATTTHEQTTLDTTTQEQTTQETTTQEQITIVTTTQKQTSLDSTAQEQTTLETTTQEQTSLATTTQKQTSLDTTAQEQTTLETTTQEQATIATTTQETTTLETTTQEQTTQETTTQEQTTQEQTTTTSLATTLTFTPTRIYMRKQFCKGDLCMCKCPCIKKLTTAQIAEDAINTVNALKVETSTLSKTVRKKISSENLTKTETNLGVTSVIFVSSVFFVIIFMDISKMIYWISTKLTKRTNRIHVDPENETGSTEEGND